MPTNEEQTTRVVRETYQQACPVCQGRGIVPCGFYMVPAGYSLGTTDASPDGCRNCRGAGVVLLTRDYEEANAND